MCHVESRCVGVGDHEYRRRPCHFETRPLASVRFYVRMCTCGLTYQYHSITRLTFDHRTSYYCTTRVIYMYPVLSSMYYLCMGIKVRFSSVRTKGTSYSYVVHSTTSRFVLVHTCMYAAYDVRCVQGSSTIHRYVCMRVHVQIYATTGQRGGLRDR